MNFTAICFSIILYKLTPITKEKALPYKLLYNSIQATRQFLGYTIFHNSKRNHMCKINFPTHPTNEIRKLITKYYVFSPKTKHSQAEYCSIVFTTVISNSFILSGT